MAECRIELEYTGDSAALFATVKQSVLKAGGTISGDSRSGSIAAPTPVGDFAGNYTLTPGVGGVIEVTKKPFLLSCARIQSELEKWKARLPAPQPTPTVSRPPSTPSRPLPKIVEAQDETGETTYYTFEDEHVTVVRRRRKSRWPVVLLLALGVGAVVVFRRGR